MVSVQVKPSKYGQTALEVNNLRAFLLTKFMKVTFRGFGHEIDTGNLERANIKTMSLYEEYTLEKEVVPDISLDHNNRLLR